MEFLFYAIAGSLLPDIIRLAKNRYGSIPDYLGNINFYIGLILLVGLGVLAVYLKQPTDELETLAIAFSAPQIISSLIGSKLNTPSDPGKERSTLINLEANENKLSGGLANFLKNWW